MIFNSSPRLEKHARDKHCGLFVPFVNYGHKKVSKFGHMSSPMLGIATRTTRQGISGAAMVKQPNLTGEIIGVSELVWLYIYIYIYTL